jgi:ParB family chromosome partitioning protein
MTIEFHEVANIFPMMSATEFEQLKTDIQHNGLLEAIWRHDGKIIDGRNRYQACVETGVTPHFREWDGIGSLTAFVVSLNLHRRHLTESQRGMVAAKLANMELGQNQHSLGSANLQTHQISRAESAELLNVSERTVNAAAKVKDEGALELVRAVESGAASVSAAAQVATLPIEEQREIVAKGSQAIVEAAKAVREGKSPHVAHNSGNNEWYTPQEYIKAAREVLGDIDLDPASSDIANQTVQAKHYFTAEVDGLAHEWSGRIWMNPPYSSDLIGQFISKLIQHYDEGKIEAAIVLVNNATETRWFQELAHESAAVCFPRGRVRFLDPNGQPGTPLQGQALLYIGDNIEGFTASFLQFGVVFS